MIFQRSSILIRALFLLIFSTSLYSGTKDDNQVYTQRLAKLMGQIENGVAIIQNSNWSTRTNDVNYYPMRANSNFYYLTGIEEPEVILVLAPGAEKKVMLFVEPKNAFSAQWHGDVPGVAGAMAMFGADTAFALADFENVITQFLVRKENVYFDFGNEEHHEIVTSKLERLGDYGP